MKTTLFPPGTRVQSPESGAVRYSADAWLFRREGQRQGGGLKLLRRTGNGKAAGDGGVLAADSLLNGADSVEACTAAAFDVITAFAVPSPGCQIRSRFFRVRGSFGSPRRAGHPAYFGSATCWEAGPFG